MSLGINIQWGNAGIVNFGVMGFAALGGLANVIISMPPTNKAWETGGIYIILGLLYVVIVLGHGWRLDPILIFGQYLLFIMNLAVLLDNVRLRRIFQLEYWDLFEEDEGASDFSLDFYTTQDG